MRIRFVLALMVTGLLSIAATASAQDTTTEPLSTYTSTTPTVTTETTETAPAQAQGTTTEKTPTVEGQTQSNVAPSVAAQPAAQAASPNTLAYTGGQPLLLIIAGLVLVSGTGVLLVREHRRASDRS